ncbi:MAG: ankyrin repeat domain-containing protein [Treponema sp.]|nr:ankyrin repeat domain-containing protein [Treponema sp.]
MENLQELISAIENCDTEKISYLAKNGMDMNCTDASGCIPLFFAIRKFGGMISSVSFEKNSNKKQTAALAEIAKKATAVISALLENGADVCYEDADGCTALGLLKFFLFLGMLAFLPSAADGVIARKKEVMQLVSKMFHDMTLILIEAGADENRTNKFGETPAKYAGRIMTEEMEKRA